MGGGTIGKRLINMLEKYDTPISIIIEKDAPNPFGKHGYSVLPTKEILNRSDLGLIIVASNKPQIIYEIQKTLKEYGFKEYEDYIYYYTLLDSVVAKYYGHSAMQEYDFNRNK